MSFSWLQPSVVASNPVLQIILSFIITAGIAVLLSASVIYGELQGKRSTIRRKLLNGYSDSQILQGIGIQCKSERFVEVASS
jgi:hypothetical protein